MSSKSVNINDTYSKCCPNYQDILKALAIITMIIDHIGMYFFPDTTLLRDIGRIAMPIFCFFVGYNFNNRINFRILLYGIILHIFRCLYGFTPIEFVNILITIFLGQVVLYILSSLYNYLFQDCREEYIYIYYVLLLY